MGSNLDFVLISLLLEDGMVCRLWRSHLNFVNSIERYVVNSGSPAKMSL